MRAPLARFATGAVAAALVAASLLPGSGTAAEPARAADNPVDRSIRLHGTVEPVRGFTVAAPRLASSGPGVPPTPQVVVRLARGGTRVQPGDLLVEFDRQAQLKAARDREAEYRDILEQINKRRGEIVSARALRGAELKKAENDLRIAELDLTGEELLAKNVAEKNQQLAERARARLAQLRHTSELRDRAETADLRMLDIRRQRALGAWRHAQRNAERMRIVAPIAGLVVLKSVWKMGTMAEVQEGEEVRPGTPILEVVDPTAMRVRAKVNQADVDGLAPGQAVRIVLDSYAEREFTGRLEQLSPVAMTSMLSNRVRTFVATFSVDGEDEHLLPDLAAAVDIRVTPPPSTPAHGERP